MTLLISGAVAAILGMIGLVEWRADFAIILKGAVPVFLLLGGVLAMYAGFDEIQEKIQEDRRLQEENLSRAKEEIEMVKAKAEQYKEELDKLKEAVQMKQ